jgi:hypothetical protein
MPEVENSEIQSNSNIVMDKVDSSTYEKLYDRMVLFTFFIAGPLLGIAMSLKMFGVATIGTVAFAYLTLQNKRYRTPALLYTGLLIAAVVVCVLRR